MKANHLLIFVATLLVMFSCKNDKQEQKEQAIENSVEIMKREMDSIENEASKVEVEKNKSHLKSNEIIGVWEVKNDYNWAIYEIERYKNSFVGKIHYYNDGTTEYTKGDKKAYYFLSDLVYENGIYTNGKIHMLDGSNYQVIITLKDKDELELKMTVEGQPYTETWKRQKTN
jgi:hypothetical protein